MTSLLSIQYVTPLTSHQEVVNNNSRLNTHVNNNNTEPEMYKLRNIMNSKQQQQQRTPSLNNNNRLAYVDALVDANALVIESIWQISTSTTNNKSNTSSAAVVPLRTFIQEVLKRSRTTYSTLQTALFYLFRSRPEIKIHLSRMQQQRQSQWEDVYVSCGRRMFLASLVVASKFVQDKTYRNSAWAKIAGLPVSEINAAERIFLNIIDYRLYISQPTFEQWHHLLHMHVEAKTLNQPNTLQDFSGLPFAPIELYTPTTNHHYIHHHQPPLLSLHTQQQQQEQQHYHHIISPTTPLSSNHTPSPRTPRGITTTTTNNNNNGNHGWTLVLSPTTFLPAPQQQVENSRKRRCCQQQQTNSNSSYYSYPPPPVLSMSLPSSINSSPMQTPTQISPVRMNNGTSVFNWNSPTSFDHNNHRSIMNTIITSGDNNNKKRKFNATMDQQPNNTRSYNISNVRQQSKRFHP